MPQTECTRRTTVHQHGAPPKISQEHVRLLPTRAHNAFRQICYVHAEPIIVACFHGLSACLRTSYLLSIRPADPSPLNTPLIIYVTQPMFNDLHCRDARRRRAARSRGIRPRQRAGLAFARARTSCFRLPSAGADRRDRRAGGAAPRRLVAPRDFIATAFPNIARGIDPTPLFSRRLRGSTTGRSRRRSPRSMPAGYREVTSSGLHRSASGVRGGAARQNMPGFFATCAGALSDLPSAQR